MSKPTAAQSRPSSPFSFLPPDIDRGLQGKLMFDGLVRAGHTVTALQAVAGAIQSRTKEGQGFIWAAIDAVERGGRP